MVIRGQEAVVRSRYEEDVYPGDHSSVWGSYWADGKWGYACCKSHLKNSLCMGNRVEEVAQQRSRQTDAADQASKDKAGRTELNSDSGRNGESDAGLDSTAHVFCCELRHLFVLVQ
jgi:pre-mRNA-processing factor SLU7